ncbi:alpha/beta-hydrolase [Neoconidiobolus thromboides FSU 785]|nr:alpha/beta-hydrolase [Neoconidiobolus thromboides FSU 785]
MRNPHSIFSTWFLPKSNKILPLELTKGWLCWALFYKKLEQLTEREVEEFEYIINLFKEERKEDKTQEVIKDIKCMSLNLDDVEYEHKPLISYLIIYIIQSIGSILLKLIGFREEYCSTSNLKIWLLEPKSYYTKSKEKPIVFIHGVGIGLIMYLRFIIKIRLSYPDRRVILVEVPYVSLTMTNQIGTRDNTIHYFDILFHRYNILDCQLIGHSYGTIIASWLIQDRPHYVNQVQLIDPVCFLMWESDLIYNFLYKPRDDLISTLAYYFLSKDLFMANVFYRHFNWYENLLFLQDLNNIPCNVYLSEKDWIISANKIHSYIEEFNHNRENIKVHIMKEFTHGQYLLCDKSMEFIMRGLEVV